MVYDHSKYEEIHRKFVERIRKEYSDLYERKENITIEMEEEMLQIPAASLDEAKEFFWRGECEWNDNKETYLDIQNPSHIAAINCLEEVLDDIDLNILTKEYPAQEPSVKEEGMIRYCVKQLIDAFKEDYFQLVSKREKYDLGRSFNATDLEGLASDGVFNYSHREGLKKLDSPKYCAENANRLLWAYRAQLKNQ